MQTHSKSPTHISRCHVCHVNCTDSDVWIAEASCAQADGVSATLDVLQSLGVTWKKQTERGKPVFFVYLEKKKIGRAKCIPDIKMVVERHRESLKLASELCNRDAGSTSNSSAPGQMQAQAPVGAKRKTFVASYDDVTRRKAKATPAAGPGRGHKVQDTSSVRIMTTQGALVDETATSLELRSALLKESKAHTQERQQHGQTKRKLAQVSRTLDLAAAIWNDAKYGDDAESDKRRRVAINELTGQGYSDLSGSYFRHLYFRCSTLVSLLLLP